MTGRWFYGILTGLALMILLQGMGFPLWAGLGFSWPAALVGVVLWEGLVRRCYLYVYQEIELPFIKKKIRQPVLVGYLRSDGTLINVLRPLGDRRVGQVYLKEGSGWVRLYRPTEIGERQPVDVGYVTPEGLVCTPAAEAIVQVNPHGHGYWYELWTHRHVDIPEDVLKPEGHCVETGCWRRRVRPGEATLLARGVAALVLYREWVYRPTEAPHLPPYTKWDTVFPTTLLFALSYLVPGWVDWLWAHPPVLPVLGPPRAFLVTMGVIYFLLWALLHALKIYWHSRSDRPMLWLEMIHRQTGIVSWNLWGAILSGVCTLWTLRSGNFRLVPLWAALAVGFAVTWAYAPSNVWPVEDRGPRRPRVPTSTVQPEGDEVKTYDWELDSPLRRARLQTSLRFDPEEVRQIRESNPFYRDWQSARVEYRRIARDLVLQGEQMPHVHALIGYIRESSERLNLAQFEEIQCVIDFVQEPNIRYALDEACPEIGNSVEYFRSAVETLYDQRGDCDCKSILAASMLRAMGYPVLLCFSLEAGHAAIAVGGAPDIEDDVFFIDWEGQRFYFCELTSDGWRVGERTPLAEQMIADPTSVIPVVEWQDCPSCGSSNVLYARQCTQCGTSLRS